MSEQTPVIHCSWDDDPSPLFDMDVSKFACTHRPGALAECDAWVCCCGNVPEDSGFYHCDQNGQEVEPTPELWTGLYYCAGCGVILHQASGLEFRPAEEMTQ